MWYNLFVANVFPSSSVLLTYKNKLLLLGPEAYPNPSEQPLWRLVGGLKGNKETNKDTIYRKIKHTTSLELKDVNISSPFNDLGGECVYHVELTDKDVNKMERREGQRLEFFTLAELSKLSLTEATEVFFTENKTIIEGLLARHD